MLTLATRCLTANYLKLNLQERGFGFCPEVTAKIS
jgi:hypothetical protein